MPIAFLFYFRFYNIQVVHTSSDLKMETGRAERTKALEALLSEKVIYSPVFKQLKNKFSFPKSNYQSRGIDFLPSISRRHINEC